MNLTCGIYRPRQAPVIIFDCNGVLVDSEPLAATIVSQEFIRAALR